MVMRLCEKGHDFNVVLGLVQWEILHDVVAGFEHGAAWARIRLDGEERNEDECLRNLARCCCEDVTAHTALNIWNTSLDSVRLTILLYLLARR